MEIYELTSDCYVTVTRQGLGESIESISPDDISMTEKTIFISDICWEVAIWVARYSILAFYWRLFSTNRRLVRVVIWVLTALMTCWGIAVVCSRPTVSEGWFYRSDIYGL